jgi:hypothetical protein
MLYVTVDVYPDPDGPHFAERVGAIAGCWIRRDLADEAEAAALVRDRLSSEGWKIARPIATEIVSPATYPTPGEARDRFEQALIDGFVAQFHCRRREVIVAAEHDDADAEAFSEVAAYRLFVQQLRERGALSLYSAGDNQFARGVSPDGDDFVPIWINEDSIRYWMHGWPDY